MEPEDSSDNGLVLNTFFLPEEVLTYILSFVNPESLIFNCRNVCKKWKLIIDDNEVWKLKLLRSKVSSLSKLSTDELKHLILNYRSHWYLYFWILQGVPFEQNLLRNNCGKYQFKYWKITKPSVRRADKLWAVEPQPIFAEPLPKCDDFESNESCFSTSYILCTKYQMIDLKKNGYPGRLLDEFQPPITVSEWYAGRYDCGCIYTLEVFLLNEKKEVILSMEPIEKTRSQWQGQEWNKVEFTFKNYGHGLRFIKFEHSGKDRQYWAGNYGSKMAGGVVKISFPEIQEDMN